MIPCPPCRHSSKSGCKRFGWNRIRQQLGAVGVRDFPDEVGRADGRILERPEERGGLQPVIGIVCRLDLLGCPDL